MKKLVLLAAATICTLSLNAASYGIMVNGSNYHAGTLNPAPLDPNFDEYQVLGLQLSNGDALQIWDYDNSAGFAIDLDGASIDGISRDGDHYNCTADGCYEFYIKLQWENDQCYVGPCLNNNSDHYYYYKGYIDGYDIYDYTVGVNTFEAGIAHFSCTQKSYIYIVYQKIGLPGTEYALNAYTEESVAHHATLYKVPNPFEKIAFEPGDYTLYLYDNGDGTLELSTILLPGKNLVDAENPLPTYTITTQSSDTKMGVTRGDGTYNQGESISIAAVANQGYQFVRWQDGNTDNPRTVVITQDTTFTAEFAKSYTLNVECDNNKGIVYYRAWRDSVPGYENDYEHYDLFATPKAGYHFVKWSDGGTEGCYYAVRITQDTTFIAEFAPNQYSISVSSSDNTKGSVTGSDVYDFGAVATLTATPNIGFQFNSWSDGNTDNPRYVAVVGDAAYIALFDTKMCKLTIKANDMMAGGVKGAGTFEYGEQVEISAKANSGYQFVKWSNGETYNPYVFTIVDDMELIAFFQRTEADPVNVDEVTVTPEENSANIQWPQVDNAYTYTLIIWADAAQTEKICTLVFDASGRLTSINFNKKPRTSTSQTEQLSGFSFTVTGLDENTEYFYSLAAKDEHDNLIGEEEKGSFTTKGTATGVEEMVEQSDGVLKVLRNGQLYILRNGEMYNAQGARVE